VRQDRRARAEEWTSTGVFSCYEIAIMIKIKIKILPGSVCVILSWSTRQKPERHDERSGAQLHEMDEWAGYGLAGGCRFRLRFAGSASGRPAPAICDHAAG
jgi:hypothetical protein